MFHFRFQLILCNLTKTVYRLLLGFQLLTNLHTRLTNSVITFYNLSCITFPFITIHFLQFHLFYNLVLALTIALGQFNSYAAFYLKENDRIFTLGQLSEHFATSVDNPSQTIIHLVMDQALTTNAYLTCLAFSWGPWLPLWHLVILLHCQLLVMVYSIPFVEGYSQAK